MQIRFVTVPHLKTPEGTPSEEHIANLFPVLEFSHTCAKEDAPCWAPVVLREGATRVVNANIASVTAAVLDLEARPDAPDLHPDPARIVDAFAGVAFAVHNTASWTPEAPRYRLVLPYDHPLDPEQHRQVYAALRARLAGMGIPSDPACSDPRRLYFCPHSAAPMRFVSGGALDTATLFSEGMSLRRIRQGAPLPTAKPGATRAPLQPVGGVVPFVREVARLVEGRTETVDLWSWAESSPLGATFKCFCPSLQPHERGSLSAWTRRAHGGVYVFCNAEGHDHTVLGCAAPSDRLRLWSPDSILGPSVIHPDVAPLLQWNTKVVAGAVVNTTPKNTFDNHHLILMRDPRFTGRLRYNAFAERVEIDGAAMTKAAQHDIQREVEKHYPGMRLTKDDYAAALELAARQDTFNPLLDEINAEPWDGVQRIDNLLTRTGACEDTPLNRRMLRGWILQAVNRARKPGSQADVTLILASDEHGTRKTSFFRSFAGPWFSNTKLDLTQRATPIALKSAWVFEMGEMSSFKRSDNETIKNFLTQTEDKFVAPYDVYTSIYKRHCVFCATTNERDILTDPTGGRRFWIIPIQGVIDHHYIEEHRLQLYAEARVALDNGEKFWFDDANTEDPMVNALREQQLTFVATRPWEEEVARFVSSLSPDTLAISLRGFMLDTLRLDPKDAADTRNLQAVGKAFTQHGWHHKRASISGHNIALRVRPAPKGRAKIAWEARAVEWFRTQKAPISGTDGISEGPSTTQDQGFAGD